MQEFLGCFSVLSAGEKSKIRMATERDKEKVFSKTDMERVALFQEMGYICGDKFKTANSRMY